MGRPGGFRSPADRETYVAAYGDTVARAGVRFEQIGLISRHGRTHVMRTGPSDGPPVVFLHPRALSSTVWIPTVRPFTETHHVHLVDVVGDMNIALASLTMPVTVLVGEDDAVVDSPRVVTRARQRLPNARVRVVADANHLVTADRPEVVLEELERLLAAPC